MMFFLGRNFVCGPGLLFTLKPKQPLKSQNKTLKPKRPIIHYNDLALIKVNIHYTSFSHCQSVTSRRHSSVASSQQVKQLPRSTVASLPKIHYTSFPVASTQQIRNKSVTNSSSSTLSRQGPQRHSHMTTCGGSSPQVSWCWWRVVVVPAQLVNSSVVGTTWATLPGLVRKMAESQIDMTPECLVTNWCGQNSVVSVESCRFPIPLQRLVANLLPT